MKKRVTVYTWLLVIALAALWVCGIITGFMVGTAKADACYGWSGRFFNTSQCDNGSGCTGFSVGPFWTQNCNNPQPYYPPPGVNP